MDNQGTTSYEPRRVEAVDGDDRDIGVATRARPVVADRVPDVEVSENVMTVRNLVQWGPVLAGLVTTITTMLILTVLGLAIGFSVFEPGVDASELGTSAAIWSAASALIAFFAGGWVAAKAAAVGGAGAGLMNGFIVGAATVVLTLWLTSVGLGNLFGLIGSNVGDIAAVGGGVAATTGVTETVDEVDAGIGEATDAVGGAATAAYDEAESAAWGTLGALILALGAASLGGLVGHNEREELIQGTG